MRIIDIMEQSQQNTKQQSMSSVVKIKRIWLLPIFLILFGAIEGNARCRHTEFAIYYPNAQETTCQGCPKCPAGYGLPIQCGDRVANGTSTECIPCVANTYSMTNDSTMCKPCNSCDREGKKMLTECNATQNRICDSTQCQDPEYYLDSLVDRCKECYFCCDTVSKGERLQECKDIGMPRSKQCEKIYSNEQCKLASDRNKTHGPTTDGPTTDDHVYITDENSILDDSSTSSTLKDKDNKGHITTQAILGAVGCLVVICPGIIIIYIYRRSLIRHVDQMDENSDNQDRGHFENETTNESHDGNDFVIMMEDLDDLNLSEIPPDLEDILVMSLDVPHSDRVYGWQKVGNAAEIPRHVLTYFEHASKTGSPTKLLLEKLGSQGRTISYLIDVLQMPRVGLGSVAESILKYLS